MPAFVHHAKDVGEFQRIDALLRSQPMLLEESCDLAEMLDAAHPVFPSLAVIPTHAPEAEKSLQCVQNVEIAAVLNDAEFRDDLHPDTDRRVSLDSDEEAPFSVDESDHPIRTEFHCDCQLLFELGCLAYRL